MADLIGHVVLFRADEGGRRNPAYSGFTPMARMQGGTCAMACHFMSEDCLNPGESDAASISLTIPELCNRINSGDAFELEENGKVVGRLTVLENLWKDRNRHKKATLTSMTPLLFVSNMRSTFDFYGKMGFEKMAELGPKGREGDWLSIQRNDIILMLRKRENDDPAGAGTLYITTDDLPTLHRSLQEAGLHVTQLYDNAGKPEFGLTDPDGWRLWFVQGE